MRLLIYLLPGLLLGMAMHCAGLSSPLNVRRMLAGRRMASLRCTLAAMGFGMLLTALLSWLAVIDIDGTHVMAVNGRLIAGALIAGLALGLTGCSPGVCIAQLGGGRFIEGLCGVLGVITGAAVFRMLGDAPEVLNDLLPGKAMTLFRTTLDKPWLFPGSFGGAACIGAAFLLVSLLLPREKHAEAVPAEQSVPSAPPPPDALPSETFVAALPEEEPIVIDTSADDAAADELPDHDQPDEEPPEDDEDALRELAILDGTMNDDDL